MITVAAAAGTVRLRITMAVGDVGDPMTVTATPTGGATRTVRGWSSVVAPAVAVVVDHEAELNISIRYAVLVNGLEVEASTVTLTAELPLVSDPIFGRHVPVIIQSWPELQRERTGQELQISDSSSPVIVEGPEMLPRSTATLILPDGSAAGLDALLAGSSVVRVRPSCPHLSAAWVSVRSRGRRRFSLRPDAAGVETMTLTHLGMPQASSAAVGNTLGDLAAEEPGTLADIAARWTTLADIAFEDLTA